MKKYIKVITVVVLLIICLLWLDSLRFEKYTGESLSIGVVGEIPDVREKMITFENIGFSDLKKETHLMKYDAIFITEDNLQEASQEEYASVYNKCVVPFYFIGSTKGAVPFITEVLTYEDLPQLSDLPPFATGIVEKDGVIMSSKYGFYNDIENKKHTEYGYSMLFKEISNNKE